MKHLKTCSFCSKEVYRLAARGLCPNCYYREKRNGTPEYQDRSPKRCSLPECEEIAVAKGYCDRHYRQHHERGAPTSKRFEYWGHAAEHPLHHTHSWIKRRGSQHGGMDPSWRDFWKFVDDVGERPSPKHRLVRVRDDAPIGPANFKWEDRKIDLPVKNKEQRAAYARAYRVLHQDRTRGSDLRANYGIGLQDYEELLAAQGGVCAICAGQEQSVCHHNKRLRPLAVDHCHTTGRIRGLLCSHCNRALGAFGDSIERLEAAIRYLRR